MITTFLDNDGQFTFVCESTSILQINTTSNKLLLERCHTVFINKNFSQMWKSFGEEFGHSIRREVGYLTIHSVLHLLGYDHVDEAQKKAQMRAREERIAALIGRMQRA